jgi:cell wall-associated NlpC family hydrolase
MLMAAAGTAGLTLAAPAHADTRPPSHADTQTLAHAGTQAGETPVTLNGAQLKTIQEKRIPKPAWKTALAYAMDKRGTPYVWGGTSESGYDCSGLMLRAYEDAGIDLPRTAREQYGAFSKKIAWNDLKPGDLVFFSGLGHVGMISKPGYMVHAPHTGDVVKEEKLSDWRREAFAGAVRPDPKGVKLWSDLGRLRRSPAPSMLTATL